MRLASSKAPTQLLVNDWETVLNVLLDDAAVTLLLDGEDPQGVRALFVRETPQLLPALAVLCQGYLVVDAEYRGPKRGRHQQIDEALKEMGWSGTTAEGCRRLLPGDLRKEFETVRTTGWWNDPFGLVTKDGDLVDERCREFRDAVVREWNAKWLGLMPKELRDLTGAVCSLKPRSDELDSEERLEPDERDQILATPELVAEAYRAIARRLMKEL